MFSRKPRDEGHHERGVSEVLAFILVFTIIIGSVAIVSVIGLQSMNSYQEGEQLRNAERGFDALSDNFNDIIRYDGIKDRSGELNLRDGSISTDYEGTELTITVDGTVEYDNSTGGLVYQSSRGSDTIAYEGGGIFRGDGEGSVALEYPMIRCTGDRAVITILQIEPDARTFASSETSRISISETNATRETYTNVDNVEIVVGDSEYENGWEMVLENRFEGGECTLDDGTVTIHIIEAEIDF
ncbi:hypothetical protein OB919_12095 [Halobacteria archaeon AArc-curdl1]|uniref:Uncharacterized protein n=1 Tax=Natronosalvus hydrolyticus TaxID=2979988 RepID=A0AAP2Z8K3_9EURY|nr:hypothetical protein [Halobacteria archaeon AArc-curdl1]